jgi:UDP-2-acetamido-3-amino-2,3-dideoxy-glucuronate N-acetyltransferase
VIVQKFIHKLSDVHALEIGEDTKIWQYTIVLQGAKIGKNCNICSHCFIENNVIIGNNVTIKNGVYLFDGIVIEDDVFIGHNTSFTNDKYPKSKKLLDFFPEIIIKKGASIGAGSIILPGVVIGENSIVGAGSLVSTNVPENTIFRNEKVKYFRKNDNHKNF